MSSLFRSQQQNQIDQLNALAQSQLMNTHSLSEILDPDRVQGALDEKSISSLLPLLPEGQRHASDLMSHLRSAQFHQTVNRINSLLNSNQYGQLMASFALNPAGENIGVQGLIDAVQKEVKKEEEKKAKSQTDSTQNDKDKNNENGDKDKDKDKDKSKDSKDSKDKNTEKPK